MDPIWKRSGFGQVVYMIAAVVIYWVIDHKDPTSGDLLEVVGAILLLFGYQAVRPTISVKESEQEHQQILDLLEQQRIQIRRLEGQP